MIINFKNLLCLIVILSSFHAFADENKCRELVISSYNAMGEQLATTEFSSKKYVELKLSITDFNKLSSEEQDLIYTQLKPLTITVEETIAKLNQYIERYTRSYRQEQFMLNEIAKWREHRDSLRSCGSV